MKKIIWEEINTRCLRATIDLNPTRWDGLTETDLDPIQIWCEEHQCGVRTSFDTFRFCDKKQITMFLLKWG